MFLLGLLRDVDRHRTSELRPIQYSYNRLSCTPGGSGASTRYHHSVYWLAALALRSFLDDVIRKNPLSFLRSLAHPQLQTLAGHLAAQMVMYPKRS